MASAIAGAIAFVAAVYLGTVLFSPDSGATDSPGPGVSPTAGVSSTAGAESAAPAGPGDKQNGKQHDDKRKKAGHQGGDEDQDDD